MIEYGLVAALVSIAAIVALQILGGQLQIIFNTVSSYLSAASTGGSTRSSGFGRHTPAKPGLEGRRVTAPPFTFFVGRFIHRGPLVLQILTNNLFSDIG